VVGKEEAQVGAEVEEEVGVRAGAIATMEVIVVTVDHKWDEVKAIATETSRQEGEMIVEKEVTLGDRGGEMMGALTHHLPPGKSG